jgi:hypothetical protein
MKRSMALPSTAGQPEQTSFFIDYQETRKEKKKKYSMIYPQPGQDLAVLHVWKLRAWSWRGH